MAPDVHANVPVELLARGRIHPALHVDDQGVVLGRVTHDGGCQLITSARTVYAAKEVKRVLAFPPSPYPDLAGRWADDDVDAFLAEGITPTFSEVLVRLINALDAAMEFPRPEQRALVPVWIVATYFYSLFLTFPRLALSGERESGKSKLLTVLLATAWNALFMLNPTPAVLFRLVQAYKPTLLLDEVEGLSREDARDVLAIINSGYKAGGTVPRCEGKDKRRVVPFPVYSPLAMASIKAVNPTTEDRCIPLVLQRGADRRRINTEVDPAAEPFARIRAGCYRLLLTRWREVGDTYQTVAVPEWLNSRARELWRPLLAVAALADRENGLAITPDLLALARAHVEDREPVSAEGDALLAVLSERLSMASSVVIRPGELGEDLRKRLAWRDAPKPEQVGGWLRRFGFQKAKPPRDREGVRYEVTADRLDQVRARYLSEDGS